MADLEKFKLSSLLWEGDKTDEGSFGFLENFGNVVRSTASGYHLEDMLDSKLRRASMSKGSVPSCLLLDPDFTLSLQSSPHLRHSTALQIQKAQKLQRQQMMTVPLSMSLQQLSAVLSLAAPSHWAHIPLPMMICLWQEKHSILCCTTFSS